MSPRLRAALYAQAGAVFSLHPCLYAGDRPTAGRSRFATLLPCDAAVSPSNGDHAGTQRADPPPARNGPKHRGAGRSRSATGPPRQSRSTRQFFCAEVLVITRATCLFSVTGPFYMEADATGEVDMSVRPYRDIQRRACRKIHVGKVPVGGDAPITVQSMTNTDPSDVKATVDQIQALERAGADIVRVSCPDQESALALKRIVPQVAVPIVADIHFHYRRAIEAAESGAACLRINPGNIGSSERVREVIKAAKDHDCSMRIGVNACVR